MAKKGHIWGVRGYAPRENFVILTYEFRYFRPLLLIFFEITKVSYILLLNHGGCEGILPKLRN